MFIKMRGTKNIALHLFFNSMERLFFQHSLYDWRLLPTKKLFPNICYVFAESCTNAIRYSPKTLLRLLRSASVDTYRAWQKLQKSKHMYIDRELYHLQILSPTHRNNLVDSTTSTRTTNQCVIKLPPIFSLMATMPPSG